MADTPLTVQLASTNGTNGTANGTSFDFSAKHLPKKHFINNEYVTPKSDKTLSVYNPKDNSLVADDVPIGGEADVEAAVDAAEAAFPKWRKLTANARRDILLKFASLIEQYTEALSELSRITLGAPYGSFGKFEVGMAAEVSFWDNLDSSLANSTGLQVQCWMDRQIRGRSAPTREWFYGHYTK